MLHFPLISRKLQYFMYLVLWHRFAPNLIGKILIIKKYVHSIFMHIYWQVAVLLACLFSSKYTRRKKTGLAKIFDFRFSMDLRVLRCPEHDLTIFRKCLSVRLQNFVNTVYQELMHGNCWNFMLSYNLVLIRFWCTSLKRSCCYLNFSISLTYSGTVQNCVQFHLMQIIKNQTF